MMYTKSVLIEEISKRIGVPMGLLVGDKLEMRLGTPTGIVLIITDRLRFITSSVKFAI